MCSGWKITCGKCGAVATAEEWLAGEPVLRGDCHFQCPHCGVRIRRKTAGVKRISINGAMCYVPARIEIVEVG
jgi:hypothetical protein